MEPEENPSIQVDNEDPNRIIMPGKRKNKNQKKKKKDKVPERLKTVSNPKLSKSQKRKLERLEEEKKKALLLSQSIETLEKYKLRDDVYSLMRSSRNLGQVETVREKRQREVQFSKAGLAGYCDQPFKKRTISNSSCEVEHFSDTMQVAYNDDSAKDRKEAPCNICTSSPSSKGLTVRNEVGMLNGDSEILVKKVPHDNIKLADPQSVQKSPLKCYSDDQNIKMLKDTDDEDPGVNSKDKSILAMSNPEGPATALDGVHVSRRKEDEAQKDSHNWSRPSANSLQERPLVAPKVVHVSRSEEVDNQRKNLPIVMMEQEIMEAINENMSVIICGETGCGKTTQVPQFLYEAGFGSKQSSSRGGIIGVTQPRRVAVFATARRVAYELGLHLGREVGFQVRHDKRVGENCSIKFMTDGILLREVQSDFLLKHYSIIILDEAHERSLNTDILIGMLSRVIRERQREFEEQEKKVVSGEYIKPENRIYPLKLILMSATLRVEDFVSSKRIFHVPPPVMEVPTRQYPVTIHFSKRTEVIDYVGQAYQKVLSIHRRLPPGGILVFVTGQREVEYLCRKLHKASREIVNKVSKVKNESSSVSGEITGELNDMKEINEAFDGQDHSGHDITDRFNSCEEDNEDVFDNESDSSYDSEDESDLKFSNQDENLFNEKPAESDSQLANILQNNGSLSSLKAAFEALAGKGTTNPDLQEQETSLVLQQGGAGESSSTTGNTGKMTNGSASGPMSVLPLYAMLPASAQLRVFEAAKEGERLVIIATNVAETSLTIPGIKYVVDTGREKVKKYNSSNGMEAYEIQWISKASAAQRAGRAGRTGPGHCYRLYSSAVFSNIFPDFSSAEISKVPVDGVVLLMKSMHIGKVANFPFPTPPEATAIAEAERCLKVLEALDNKGQMTTMGKAMARFPMSPRHSRMLLTVMQIMRNVNDYARANLVLGYTVAAAAALSLSNPFSIQFGGNHTDEDEYKQGEKAGTGENGKVLDREAKRRKKKMKEAAKDSRAKFSNPTSDVLTTAYALQCFELSVNPVEFCSDNFLHLKTMEEMSKLRKQLLHLVFGSRFSDTQHEFVWIHGEIDDVERAWRVSSGKNPLLLNEEEVLGQAICAGWADRVAKRSRSSSGLSDGDRRVNAVRYQACMVNETVFLHRWSSVSKSAPEFLVYSELLQTKRPYIHGATCVKSEWLVKYAHSLCSFSAPHSDPKPYYDPPTDQVFSWVTPIFGPHLWQLPLHSSPIKDDMNRVAVFAFSLLEGQVLPCLKTVRKFMAASPASILRPEGSGVKRVVNLLSKLKSRRRVIDCCSMLRQVWKDTPMELFPELQDWFQEGFHDHFEELWKKMHCEVLLDPKDRARKLKKAKRRA